MSMERPNNDCVGLPLSVSKKKKDSDLALAQLERVQQTPTEKNVKETTAKIASMRDKSVSAVSNKIRHLMVDAATKEGLLCNDGTKLTNYDSLKMCFLNTYSFLVVYAVYNVIVSVSDHPNMINIAHQELKNNGIHPWYPQGKEKDLKSLIQKCIENIRRDFQINKGGGGAIGIILRCNNPDKHPVPMRDQDRKKGIGFFYPQKVNGFHLLAKNCNVAKRIQDGEDWEEVLLSLGQDDTPKALDYSIWRSKHQMTHAVCPTKNGPLTNASAINRAVFNSMETDVPRRDNDHALPQDDQAVAKEDNDHGLPQDVNQYGNHYNAILVPGVNVSVVGRIGDKWTREKNTLVGANNASVPSKTATKQGVFVQKQAVSIDQLTTNKLATAKPQPEALTIHQTHSRKKSNQSPAISANQAVSKEFIENVTKIVQTVIKKEMVKLSRILSAQTVSEKSGLNDQRIVSSQKLTR